MAHAAGIRENDRDLDSPCEASGPRAPERAGAATDAGFCIATKVFVYAVVAFALCMRQDMARSALLSCALMAYLALGKRSRMAWSFAVSYAVLAALYVLMFSLGIRLIVFSAAHVLQMLLSFPALIAFMAIATSPPGMISSALAKLRLPKKAIVGTLVILRFFPTVTATLSRLVDSMRIRGLLDMRRMTVHVIDTLEYLLVPIMLSLVNSADNLSSSAIARAAEAPAPRTSYYEERLRISDAACMAGTAALAAALVLL